MEDSGSPHPLQHRRDTAEDALGLDAGPSRLKPPDVLAMDMAETGFSSEDTLLYMVADLQQSNIMNTLPEAFWSIPQISSSCIYVSFRHRNSSWESAPSGSSPPRFSCPPCP